MAIVGVMLVAGAFLLVWAGYKGRNPWEALRAFLDGDPDAFRDRSVG